MMKAAGKKKQLKQSNIHVCGTAMENTMPVKTNSRSRRMKDSIVGKRKSKKNNITLVCVFPSESNDASEVKRDVNNILKEELKHQLQEQHN